MTEEPAKPEKQLTPQTERVLQNSILVLREARHPLTSIVGFSEVMLKSEDSTDIIGGTRGNLPRRSGLNFTYSQW